MTSVSERIELITQSAPEGATLSAKNFLHLGSRAAVDQALSRLAREGRMLRVARGVYVRPIEGKFGSRPPSPEKVVEAFAALKGETVASSGAAAANAMGLTTQVPVRQVYLTSGPNRELRVGGQVIEFQHAPAWQLALSERPAGTALRALAWLGPKHARKAVRELKRRLPTSEYQAMASIGGRLPTWAATRVSALANG
jgi:Family of unknown function (DUF6088)